MAAAATGTKQQVLNTGGPARTTAPLGVTAAIRGLPCASPGDQSMKV
jgi:hypothetical protein